MVKSFGDIGAKYFTMRNWVDKMTDFKTCLKEVIDLFPDHVKENELYPHYYRFLLTLKSVSPHIRNNNKVKILDVGADGGVISLVFKKMGHDVSAIDVWERYTVIDEDVIEERSHRERLDREGVETHYCDIVKEPLPFEDSSFDIVFCTETIEHLHSSPRKPLDEIRRVLKRNGILILSTPNIATLKNRLYVLAGRSNHTELSYWYYSEPFLGHMREYTVSEIKTMLRWEGFTIEQVRLSNCLQIPTIRHFKLKPKKLAMSLYLLVTTLVPTFRYLIVVVGRKE